jgi:hypothetical protein
VSLALGDNRAVGEVRIAVRGAIGITGMGVCLIVVVLFVVLEVTEGDAGAVAGLHTSHRGGDGVSACASSSGCQRAPSRC